MLLSSRCGNFLEEVLSVCGRSRLSETAELDAAFVALFGPSRPAARTEVLSSVRLAFCHALLLLFHIAQLTQQRVGQPERFAVHTASLLRERLLPPLRRALDGAVANRWAPLREALGALVVAAEKAPLPEGELPWLRRAQAAFRTFAMGRFLQDGGSSSSGSSGSSGSAAARQAEALLDPFGHPGAVAAAAASQGRTLVLAAPVPAPVLPRHAEISRDGAAVTSPKLTLTVTQAPAVPASPLRASAAAAATGDEVGRAAAGTVQPPVGSGANPRRPEMRFFRLTGASAVASAAGGAAAAGEVVADPDPRGLLPRPLPLGVEGDTRRGLARSGLPPLAGKGAPHGFFYNAKTAEFVC